MVRLQSDPIRAETLIQELRGDGDGALGLFLGVVRERNEGRRVLHLEYHAYDEMALAELRRLEDEALRRFEVSAVGLVHRTGRLEIGETAVAVAVAAPHRAPALDACRFLIESLKRSVPIWKKEFFEGGESWIEGPGAPPQ